MRRAKKFILPVVFLFLLFSFADKFETLLSRNQMSFKKPKGLQEVEAVANRQMNYEKAYKHKKKKFELRFAVRPYDKLFAEYKRSRKDSTFYIADPNTMYKTSFTSTLLNISDGKDYSYSIYDSVSAKKEYNADWVAIATVDVGKEFGGSYRLCRMLYLFKRDTGEAYYFFLADEMDVLNKFSGCHAHELKFR